MTSRLIYLLGFSKRLRSIVKDTTILIDLEEIGQIRETIGGFVKVAIGCDHAGLELKREVMVFLDAMGFECIDYGTDSPQSVDYPDFGEKVSAAVTAGTVERGVLICGTGIGMVIVIPIEFGGFLMADGGRLWYERESPGGWRGSWVLGIWGATLSRDVLGIVYLAFCRESTIVRAGFGFDY